MGMFDHLPNEGESVSRTGGLFDHLPDEAPNDPGFISTIKRTGANMAGTAATALEDVTGKNAVTQGVQDWSKGIEQRNPAGIQSLSDIAENPWLTVKEGVGNMAAQMPVTLGASAAGSYLGGLAGAALGGPPGAAVGATAGRWLGAAVPTFLQEYGGIRQDQQEAGIDDKRRALAAAIPATAIEFNPLGPEAHAIKLMAGGAGKQLFGKGGKQVAKDLGKAAGIGALTEGPMEEYPQSLLEAWGAHKDPFSAKEQEQAAVSAILGAVGGGVMGPINATAGGIRAKNAEEARIAAATAEKPATPDPIADPIATLSDPSAGALTRAAATGEISGANEQKRQEQAIVTAATVMHGGRAEAPTGLAQSVTSPTIATTPIVEPEAATLAAAVPLNTPAAPDIAPVNPAAPIAQTFQAEPAGVPTSPPQGQQPDASQAEVTIPQTAGRAAQPAEIPAAGVIPELQYPQQPTSNAGSIEQTSAPMSLGKYGRQERPAETYQGMTADEMATVASRHGYDYAGALEKIKAKPHLWVSTVQKWLDVEAEEKRANARLKRSESWVPSERQQKVINLIADQQRYSKDRDAPMFSHNAGSTRALISRGVLARYEDGDSVQYSLRPIASAKTNQDMVDEARAKTQAQRAIVVANETSTGETQAPLSGADETQAQVEKRKAELLARRKATAQQPPIMRRDDLVGAIMRVTGGDGIASDMAQTIAGDKANGLTKLRGLFTNRGTSDLGDVAMLLREEEGYDVRDGEHLSELIRAASFGDTAVNMDRQQREADANKEKQHRDRIRAQAKKYGIKSIGINFSDLETRVFAMMESRRKKAVDALDARAQKRFEAALSRAESALSEDDLDAVLADTSRRGLNARDFWNEASKIIVGMVDDAVTQKAQEEANAATENADWLKDGNGRGNQSTGGRNASEQSYPASSRPDQSNPESSSEEFILAGQSAAEIARQEADRVAAEKAKQAEAEQEAKDKAADEKQSLADKIKARAANPDNFQFGEDARAAAKPMGGLFEQQAPSQTSSAPPVKAEESQSVAERRAQLEAQRAEAATARSRPKTTITFKKPIVGPSGTKILSYTWTWKPFEFIDARGEDRVGRMSDWDKAETNMDTRRDVVHQFVVEDKDGSHHVVSSETAIRRLGYGTDQDGKGFRSIESAAKTLARNQMALAEAESASAAFESDLKEIKGGKIPEAARTGEIRFGKTMWEIGEAVRYIRGNPSAEDLDMLRSEWIAIRLRERGWNGVSGYIYGKGNEHNPISEKISDLKRRIEKAQARLDNLIDEQPTPEPTSSASTFVKSPDGSIDFGESIADLQAKAKAEDPFSEGFITALRVAQDAVTSDAQLAIDKGVMPIYDIGGGLYVGLSPSSQNSGMVQATRYRSEGIIGDSQYNDVASAVSSNGEGLALKRRLSDTEAAELLAEATKAEENYQARKSAAEARATNTEDSGSELTHNRRNRFHRGLKWEDIADKNVALRVKEVVKAKVYPRPDYQSLVDGGIPPIAAHLVKQVYDAIAVTPQTGNREASDADLRTYIEEVNRVMDGAIAWANDKQAVAQWAGRQAKVAGSMLGKQTAITDMGKAKDLLDVVYPGGWKNFHDEIIVAGGNKLLGALQPDFAESKRAIKDIDKGWPGKLEAWQQQGYKIVDTADVATVRPTNVDGKFYIVVGHSAINTFPDKASAEQALSEMKPVLLLNKVGRVISQHDTQAQATEAAREAVKRDSKDTTIKEEGRSVEDAERTGPARRLAGENITSDQLKETFGFKGVNFGNWMKGDTPAKVAERQLHLNHAYDAFLDLAEILGVPPRAMSLNGMMGLAIGAQGGGKALAHFVPGVNEINLTRTAGAGALAHEWGHALDHYFATMAGLDRQKAPYLTEQAGQVRHESVMVNGRRRMQEVATSTADLRPEILNQFRSIVAAMSQRMETQDEANARLNDRSKQYLGYVEGWLKAIRREFANATKPGAENMDEVRAAALEKFDHLAERIRSLELGEGKVAVGPHSAISPVVSDIREAFKSVFGGSMELVKLKSLQANIDALQYNREQIDAGVRHEPMQIPTDYQRASSAEDKSRSKPHWGTKREMFARAFDAYVVDTLAAKAAKNSYLSGIEALPPQGEERKTINRAFDKLISELKTKEGDDGNVVLYNQTGALNISPVDSAIYNMAREGKSAAEILSFIGKASRRPFNRYLANALRNIGVSSTVTLDSQGGWQFNQSKQGAKYSAAYHPKTDTVILLSPRKAETDVLHEFVHAATLKAIAKGGAASLQMRALFLHVRRDGALSGQYGMSNLDEFVAEAFSNPKFQLALKSVPAPASSKLQSAWQWFVRTVARILGMKSPGQETALDRAMTVGAQLMRENAALSGGEQGSVRHAQGSPLLAPNGQPSSLNERQWNEVRTPEFKAWFGDWELAAQNLRPAKTFSEAREAAKLYQGKPLVSEDGLTATVSRNNLDKMLSASAAHKSESTAEHALAVANLDTLFASATTGWTKSDRDGDPEISAIHRLFAPMQFDGKARLVKITVKEFARHGNRVYSVEAISVGEVSPVPEMVDADRAQGSRLLTGPTGLVDSLVQRVRDFNPDNVSKVVDKNGEPRVMYHGTSKQFSEFSDDEASGGALGQGFYFAEDKGRAEDFGSEPMSAYLRAKNPLILSSLSKPKRQTWNSLFESDPYGATKQAQEQGYDGILDDVYTDRDWIVYSPTQIKSAIGNTGQFSPDNPDIRFSTASNWISSQFKPGQTTKIIDDSGNRYTPEQRAMLERTGRVVDVKTMRDHVDELRKDWAKKLAQGIVDQFAPVKELSKEAYGLLRLSKGSSGAFEVFMNGGQLKLNGGAYDFDETKKGGVVDRLLTPLQNESGDFMWWVAANRAGQLKAEAEAAHARGTQLRANANETLAKAVQFEHEAKQRLQQAGDFPKAMMGNQQAQAQNAKEANAMLAQAKALRAEAAAMREKASELMAINRERLFSDADVAAGKTLSDGQTKFDYTLKHDTLGHRAGEITRSRKLIFSDSLKTFNEFNRNALDMAEQSGLIDPEARKIWEREFYIPFYRVTDDGSGIRGMNVKSGVVRQEAFKRLKGGTNKLNSDLLENTLNNWAHLLDAAAKNRAAVATLDAAAEAGVAAPSLKSGLDWQDGKVVSAETGNVVGDGSVKPEYTTAGKGTVWAMHDGKQEHYTVSDPYVLTAISALEYAGLRGGIMDVMGAFKRALTMGVTASPFFKVRNLIRDSLQAISSAELGYNPLTNIKEGYKATRRGADEYYHMLAGGGLIRFGTMLEGGEAARTRNLVEKGVDPSTILDNEGKIKAFYKRSVEPLVGAYNELGNRGEEVTRAALYKQLVANGMSHAEASLEARDLMDFSMQGSFTAVRFLTQVVPFMNARLQGLYKLGRAHNENPKRFYAVLGATALFSLALMAAYDDDDDWKKREDWDRDNYWWFKVGGVALRIPKPFEIGALASLAERSAELAFNNEMTGQRFRNRLLALLSDNLSMNPVPQMVKPLIDIYANKDAFTGRPIESMGMEKLEPDYRFRQSTSLVARGVSTAGNAATGGNFLSPVQVDHLVQGYLSWLGAFVVGGASMIASGASSEPDKPSRDLWKIATGGMISELDGAPSRYVTQMYDQAKQLEQAYGTYRHLQKEGKAQEAAQFAQDHREELVRYRGVESVKRAESKINDRIRAIERGNLSSDDKREKINSLRSIQDRYARALSRGSSPAQPQT